MGNIRAMTAALAGLALAATILAQGPLRSEAASSMDAGQDDPIPASLAGPFVADRDVLMLLDKPSTDGTCRTAGRLVFGCLIQAKVAAAEEEAPTGPFANPFNLRVASDILATFRGDLDSFRTPASAAAPPQTDPAAPSDPDSSIDPAQQINPGFLIDPGSRIELIGVINRIDRQFIEDIVPGAETHRRCGEVSVLYRFSYSLRGGDVASRLPVTMNVVFPAVPRSRPRGASNCAEVAARWVREMDRIAERGPDQVVADLLDPGDGVVALLDGRDIERIELNFQAYRISAGADRTDFGSTAEYVIRVFRWNPDQKKFTPSYLTNQIDRARLLGNPLGDRNSCDPGVRRPMSKARFLDYITRPIVLSDIDNGTLNIPQEFLACRAVTASPGGAHRSRNSMFWNASNPAEQIITDERIEQAMRRALSARRQFSFMKSADDFRLRINGLSCSGCHQERAIAGFHFPGADRPGAPVSNSVYLPGSAHFLGDQARRQEVLRRLARGERLSRYDLAWSYASRPLNRFGPALQDTQLIGGWGGACLLPEARAASRREWTCKPALQCVALFNSSNAPGLGTCTPVGSRQIGDSMQIGKVTTARWGIDTYLRTDPAPVGTWSDRQNRNTLIPASLLPANPPPGNSYYSAHQEYYEGDQGSSDPATLRDAQTGGFPSGMLRLSECKGLPGEATCGLTASTGFNACLTEVKAGTKTLNQCFAERTSYAGMRACNSANPCRDDYICLRPMGYNQANGHEKFAARQKAVSYKSSDYGQQEPDAAWLARNGGRGDPRGICIPPYFVFQFRSDGHPSPVARSLSLPQ
jgi:hypothetical protein